MPGGYAVSHAFYYLKLAGLWISMSEYFKAAIQGICERLNAEYFHAKNYQLKAKNDRVVVQFPPDFDFMPYIIHNIAGSDYHPELGYAAYREIGLGYPSYQYRSDDQPHDAYVHGNIRWSRIRSIWRWYDKPTRAQENSWSIICESDPSVIEEILRKILPHVPPRLGA